MLKYSALNKLLKVFIKNFLIWNLVYKNKMKIFNFCMFFLFTFVIPKSIQNENYEGILIWKQSKIGWLIF